MNTTPDQLKFNNIYVHLTQNYKSTMTKREVCEEIKLNSRALDYRREKDEFPKNIKVGENNSKTIWSTYDIAWYIAYGI